MLAGKPSTHHGAGLFSCPYGKVEVMATTTDAEQQDTQVGHVFLPGNPGQPVGSFKFLVDLDPGAPAENLEVGAFVSVDTPEGVIVGTVTDMNAIGSVNDPLAADLQPRGDVPMKTVIPEASMASAQVLASDKLRPVRSGTVRFSTAAEVEKALGQDKIRWKIPVGTVKLGTGELLPLCLDGDFTTGPEAAGVLVAGKSGLASKTSVSTVIARSMLNTAEKNEESLAVLFVNVKGADLLSLDQKPEEKKAISDDDREMYRAMGMEPEPFKNVTVYAPSLPGGTEPNSFRSDAKLVRWDLPMIWPYLSQVFNIEDNLRNLLADMRADIIENPDPSKRINTIAKLDQWFLDRFEEAEEREGGKQSAWRSHHVATLRRAHKLITSLVPRFGGLVSKESTRPEYDVPATGWSPGDVAVLDVASLQPDVQGITLGRTVSRLFESAEAGELGVDRICVIFDELNQFAPNSGGAEFAGVKSTIRDVFARGRYAGISSISACQVLSRVDTEVTQNASTKLLGVSDYGEITSGVYGSRLSAGFVEQVETAPKGTVAVFHHLFRQPVSACRFPRPAWQTGKPQDTENMSTRKKKATDILSMSEESVEKLTEGLTQDEVSDLIAKSDDPKRAIEELRNKRNPDMRKNSLHAPVEVDDEDPFGLNS